MTNEQLDLVERLADQIQTEERPGDAAELAHQTQYMVKAIRGLYASAAENRRKLLRLHERRDTLQTQFNKLERDHRLLGERFDRMYRTVQSFLVEWTKQ